VLNRLLLRPHSCGCYLLTQRMAAHGGAVWAAHAQQHMGAWGRRVRGLLQGWCACAVGSPALLSPLPAPAFPTPLPLDPSA